MSVGMAKQIVVVGAGIIGCSTAWCLSKHGFSIHLFDEHPSPFKGISSAGFGSLTPFSDPFYKGEARKFAAHAVDLYRSGWLSELSEKASSGVTFKDLGLLQLCQTTQTIAHAEDIAKSLAAGGHEARMLSVEETRKLEPHLTGDFLGALWMNEPWLDSGEYFAALEIAISSSTNIRAYYSQTVTSVTSDKSGLLIHTKSGENICCDGVVICNGLHPEPIQGVPTLHLKWLRGDAIAMHTTNGKPLLKRHVYLHDGFITPREHSEMLLGATYHDEALPSENARRHRDRIALDQFQRIVASNLSILPALSGCEVGKVWRNWRPTSPDNYPILDASSSDPRIVIANGFIGLGLTMAPAVGESITNYFSDVGRSAFPTCFALSRKALTET